MTIAATEALTRVATIQQRISLLQTGLAAPGFSSALAQAAGAASSAPTGSSSGGGVSGIPYANEINAAAARHGLDPALLAGLVKQESGFNAAIRSPAGATGLTQLMPATARSLGVTDPTDPLQSLEGGAKYLREQLDRFGGDERLALAAYNAGPGAVKRFGGIPPYRETQNYVEAVLRNRDQFSATALAPATASIVPSSRTGSTSASSALPYPTT